MNSNQHSPSVAYFSMEIGLESQIPTYSGGLGVLSGDTLRAAADLGLPVAAVTLLHRQGFFSQRLDDDGRQTEGPVAWEPQRYFRPLDARVEVEISGRTVALTAWLYLIHGNQGREIPVYLLDADLPENHPEDRALTGQLYGGDNAYRLRQEAVLGLGGIAMLRALGHDDFATYHMNEGHCALLTLALLLEQLDRQPVGIRSLRNETIEAVRSRCVFTTHTPVPAGHDRFDPGLTGIVLGEERMEVLSRLPCVSGGALNMTTLALYLSRYANGVAKRHGEVARIMHPEYVIREITNGVHVQTWAAPTFADLFDREIPGWRSDSHYLRQAITISLDAIEDAHATAKVRLLNEIKLRSGADYDAHAFTIGFARRAATYKRAHLVFSDLERLRSIAANVGPLQFVFAGKAHPHDEAGKGLIREVFEAQRELGDDVRVVYLPDYDMELGGIITAGADIWLNNPVKPQEASGTSGMKAAINGVPSFSTLDGWWLEGWVEGVTGWSIGDGDEPSQDDELEAQQLYDKLETTILPLFYSSPQEYARVRRNAIAFNGSYFTAQRMMEQYWQNAYQPRGRSAVVT